MSAKILLVDDENDIRMLFRLALQNAGYVVKEAADGLEAIGMIQVEVFDAVVLDISMPRLDGVSAIDTFRVMRNGQTVPIIVMTALSDAEVKRRAFEKGAVDFLVKPISPTDLVETLRRHIVTPNASS
ncbi:MAG: two-component system, chemotaxis family, chemotaxis protein CheY [Abditibacteriota bacterium]|nr:two-component system, chemotaxis family, chemotaxis protein CheY [Abditibacteriota bacterium]